MGLKITNYSPEKLYPIDDAHPEEYDVVVYSDISGEDITDADLWMYDGEVCSDDEMREMFEEDYVERVEEDEYEEAKNFLMDEKEYKEEQFKDKPELIKIYTPDDPVYDYIYEFKANLNKVIVDNLPDDIYDVDIDDLEDEDDYDPSDDYYDAWVDAHLDEN